VTGGHPDPANGLGETGVQCSGGERLPEPVLRGSPRKTVRQLTLSRRILPQALWTEVSPRSRGACVAVGLSARIVCRTQPVDGRGMDLGRTAKIATDRVGTLFHPTFRTIHSLWMTSGCFARSNRLSGVVDALLRGCMLSERRLAASPPAVPVLQGGASRGPRSTGTLPDSRISTTGGLARRRPVQLAGLPAGRPRGAPCI
jgi:hypothetical protein